MVIIACDWIACLTEIGKQREGTWLAVFLLYVRPFVYFLKVISMNLHSFCYPCECQMGDLFVCDALN